MGPKTLNWREVLVEKKQGGVDHLVDQVLESPDNQTSQLLELAKAARISKTKRHYIEAALLSGADIPHIADVLDFEEDVVETYSLFLYDVQGMDRLSKMSLLEEIEDPAEMSLKLWAFSQGIDFLAWRLGKSPQVSAVDGLSQLFNDCVYKAKEAFFNPNSTLSSKESVKWVKLSIEIAKLLKVWVNDSKAAKMDIELALKQIIPNFKSIDDLDDDFEPQATSKKDEGEAVPAVGIVTPNVEFPSLDDIRAQEAVGSGENMTLF